MLPLLLGLAQAGLGAYQSEQQQQMAQKAAALSASRPVLGMPTALQANLNMSKSLADSSLLPAMGYAQNQIGAQTARANQAVQQTGGSANDVIAGITQNDANARGQENNLIAAGAENQQQNRQLYSNVLGQAADQQNAMFDYNQNQPYQTNYLRAQALKDASFRNANNALNTGIDAVNNQSMGGQYDKLYGTNFYGMNGGSKMGASSPRASASLPAYNGSFSNTDLLGNGAIEN